MLFSEIYGSYFQVVAAVLTEAAREGLTDRRLSALVQEKAFAESTLSIPSALKNGDWPLLDKNNRSVLQNAPTMPLTTLQKRWLKALTLDPRIALFQPDMTGLEDVEPLFTPDTFVYYDRYLDGDPYEEAAYIACFRILLQAIREKRKVRVRFKGHTGSRHSVICIPWRLEYSAKDDKFRLMTAGTGQAHRINLARIRTCKLLEPYEEAEFQLPEPRLKELILLLHDQRNALERALLHFSHFRRETTKLDDDHYQITLRYDREDETELLIRVLSFGPMLRVQSPDAFLTKLRARLDRQLEMLQEDASL